MERQTIKIPSISKQPIKFFKIADTVLFSGYQCSLMPNFKEKGYNLLTLELLKNSRLAKSITVESIHHENSVIC